MQPFIAKLAKEPIALKWYNNLVNNIGSLITLPFRIIFYPLRRYLGEKILSGASWRSRNNTNISSLNNYQYSLERINYSTSRNKNCSMIIAYNNRSQDTVENRKLTINFHGNDVEAEESPILRDALNYSNPKNDFMAVDYPVKANSTQELVDAGVSAILRAINAGYKAENIRITGHSFGGAWSALVLCDIKQYLHKDQKFEAYINHKSFTNVGEVFAARRHTVKADESKNIYIANNKSSFFSKTVNLIVSFMGLQFDAEKAMKQNLPIDKIELYTGEHDINVPCAASIALALEIKKPLWLDDILKKSPKKKIFKYKNEDHYIYSSSLYANQSREDDNDSISSISPNK